MNLKSNLFIVTLTSLFNQNIGAITDEDYNALIKLLKNDNLQPYRLRIKFASNQTEDVSITVRTHYHNTPKWQNLYIYLYNFVSSTMKVLHISLSAKSYNYI